MDKQLLLLTSIILLENWNFSNKLKFCWFSAFNQRKWLWKKKIWIGNSKLKHDYGHFLECRPNVRRDYSHGDYVDGGDVLLTRSTTVDEGKSDLNGHNRVPPIFLFFLEGENRGSFPSHSDDRCVRNLSIIFQKWWPLISSISHLKLTYT